uniref:Protein arginine N-methyltransferase n=1 Tax=Rhodosorus marinus TaxID=101924 RepID=A0A7S0BKQ5_9RHOD|mmetsp:Transcript_21379/g.31088  ORF Transcript_21379/g.31088 Transcript_21379/m.31088 type:complete len:408 (+) Transcript_21379:111-1334(+)
MVRGTCRDDLHSDLYVCEKQGRRHKDFVTNMFQTKVPFAVSGNAATTNSAEGAKPYVMFLAHLFGKQPVDGHDADDDQYLDYLQSPLQPLADNLEGSMYETFESDPVKYARYQEAVRLYLSKKVVERVVIMVLGAGRGPLVAACLAAAEQTQRSVFIYAVEKNASAIITLRNRRDREPWKNKVKVVQADMRSWKSPEKADLIVSELLGSFGDNELSPECLSSAHKLLARDGICIPQSSTSFIAPICTQALHSNVAALGLSRAYFETPYVAKIQHGVPISSPQPCFRFTHPDDKESDDYSRYTSLAFNVEEDYMLHGFVGYFDAMLYGGIDISILPETHTPKMFSWYSIYFPIVSPLLLRKGEVLDFHMWRRSSAKKVWYEWTVTSPAPIAIHNVNGRSYSMDVLPIS